MSPYQKRRLAALVNRKTAAAAVSVVLAALAALGVVQLVDDNGDGRADRVVVPVPTSINVDGPDADSARDDVVQLDDQARALVQRAKTDADALDLAGDLRGDDPTATAGGEQLDARVQRWPGCRTMLVRSYSSRTSTVRAIALHYTVSPERAGWGDIEALTAYANNPANGASWHFLIDREGHCAYSVPTFRKAWTIAGLNSQTVNIEVVSTGREGGAYAGGGKGFAKVRDVVRRIAARYGIPLRLAATDGRCNVTRSGILTHWMGGPCSGGHSDIRPWWIRKVVRRIANPTRSPAL